MGDTPTGRPIINGDFQNTAHGARANSTQRSSASPFDESEGPKAFQGRSHAPGSQGHYPHGQSFPTQQHGSQGQQDHFNMGPLGTALPDMSYMNYGNASPQRYSSGPSPPAHLYQLQSMPQLGGPASMNPLATNLPYNVQYQAPYQSMYLPGQSQTSANSQSGLNIGNQFYQGQAFMGQAPVAPYFIQPGQYAPQGQMYSANSSSGQYGPRGSSTGDNRPLPQQRSGEYQTGTLIDGVQRISSSIGELGLLDHCPLFKVELTHHSASSTSPSSIVRGPPRKPRQSGKLLLLIFLLVNWTNFLYSRPCNLDRQSPTTDRSNEFSFARMQGDFWTRISFPYLEEQLCFCEFQG
jgi:hypothetical protein